MLIDITRTIGLDTVTYPGDPQPKLARIASMEEGHSCELSEVTMTVHAGTHIDAPAHFIGGGAHIDDLPLERFRIPAHVIDTGNLKEIDAAALEGVQLAPGEALLFKTEASGYPAQEYVSDHPGINVAAAELLIQWRAGLVGIDYISIERAEGLTYPVHRMLLNAGMLIIENLNLAQAGPGKYLLNCFPLKLHKAEAAPCRAILEPLG